jgi:hypothetical protein
MLIHFSLRGSGGLFWVTLGVCHSHPATLGYAETRALYPGEGLLRPRVARAEEIDRLSSPSAALDSSFESHL